MKLTLNAGYARTIDALAKVVTAVAIVVGGYWTVHTYTTTRADQLRTQELEARRPFLEKRLDFYLELTKAAATIASSPKPEEVADATEHFWILYNGPLLVVEEPKIQEQVQMFARCLEAKGQCNRLPELARGVAIAAGNSAGNQWTLPSAPTNVRLESH